MGLDSTDSKPKHMSLPQAYENIRRWYTQNLPLLRERPAGGDYVQRSRALIRALPPASALNDLEIRAVLGEVIYGNLEWAYHQTDGQHKMAAYAHGALEAAGLQWSLADTEKQQLKGSTLWPYLSISR
jgi:hypothetical protein